MKNNGKIINKLFRNSVISIILAAIATMIGIVIDGIIIGRFLGEDSMAAYSLVTPVINLATAFSGILATGAQIICAQHLGAGDKKSARRAFSMCMIITVIIAAFMMAGVLFFRDGISVMLGARGNSAHLLQHTSDYLLGIVFSFPCVLFLFEFNSLMRLDGDANRVIVAVVVMTLLDVAGALVNALVVHGGADIVNLMKRLQKYYLNKGIPVIIDEFGASNRNNEDIRAAWAKFYVSTADSYGIPCVLWDNNQFGAGSENLGLLNRNNLTIAYPKLLAGLMEGAKNRG